MTATAQYAALLKLDVPAVTTADAAAVWGASIASASHALRRLATHDLVVPVRRGLWALRSKTDPLLLLEYVTAPYPAYVSLHSALHAHGMVEQVPVTTWGITLGRPGRVRTAVGTYSLHRVAPSFFGGYVQLPSGVKLATPEKALVDVFYLSATRNRVFASLPEVELPATFRVSTAREWIRKIPSARLRLIATSRLEALLRPTPPPARAAAAPRSALPGPRAPRASRTPPPRPPPARR